MDKRPTNAGFSAMIGHRDGWTPLPLLTHNGGSQLLGEGGMSERLDRRHGDCLASSSTEHPALMNDATVRPRTSASAKG